MTENFQDKLHQEECKQSKGVKTCVTVRRKPESEKCSKNFLKNICKIKYTKLLNKCKNSSNSTDIFKSTKHVLEKLKKTPLTLPHLNF